MTSIILPINPIFVEEIFKLNKRYEYRKSVCKKNIDKIYIYATRPVKKVVGEAMIDNIITGDKEYVWNITKDYAGINKTFYENYFKNSKKACAYCLGKVKAYRKPKDLKDFGINFYPQSYVYV